MKLTSENNLAAKFPVITKSSYHKDNPKPASEILPGSNEKVKWGPCPDCGKVWKAMPGKITRSGDCIKYCRKCARKMAAIKTAQDKVTPTYNLAVMFPVITKSYSKDNSKPASKILPSSAEKVKWDCPDCGEDWWASPDKITRSGDCVKYCRKCAYKRGAIKRAQDKVTPTYNLAVMFPVITKSYSKDNSKPASKILPSSAEKVKWDCPDCGEDWWASPAGITLYGDCIKYCRKCAYKRGALKTAQDKVTPTHNLAAKYPVITKSSYHKDNPKPASGILPGGDTKVKWGPCPDCGEDWWASPAHIIRRGDCVKYCPDCSKGQSERQCGELAELILKNLKSADYVMRGQHKVRIKSSWHYFDYSFEKDNCIVGLLEFDGEQHSRGVRWSKNDTDETIDKRFKQIIKRDKEKDQYADEQGIPLIRTNYKEMEAFNKQIKNGIPETETDLYKSLQNDICDMINKHESRS